MFFALDPISVSKLGVSFSLGLVKYEFPLVERKGAFMTRSTITIGMREGSPKICRSCIDLLLICIDQIPAHKLQHTWREKHCSTSRKSINSVNSPSFALYYVDEAQLVLQQFVQATKEPSKESRSQGCKTHASST